MPTFLGLILAITRIKWAKLDKFDKSGDMLPLSHIFLFSVCAL